MDAVREGLLFLAREQNGQGLWETGRARETLAIAALAGLAFLASRGTVWNPEHSSTVDRTEAALVSHITPGGVIWGRQPLCFDHVLASLFLLERDQHRDTSAPRETVARTIVGAIEIQGADKGWGYSPGSQAGEMMVTVFALLFLQAARRAGYDVAHIRLLDGEDFVWRHKWHGVPEGKPSPYRSGLFSYQYGDDRRSYSLTAGAFAVVAQRFEEDDPQFRYGIGLLLDPPEERWRVSLSDPLLDRFLSTLFFLRLGGVIWARWRLKTLSFLLDAQREDGRWTLESRGDAYATALAILTLSAPWGKLVLFQPFEKSDGTARGW